MTWHTGIPYRKTHEVIGYAYDADLHCVRCTGARFENPDANDTTDSEGNPIGPIFLADEHDTEPHCGDCHEPLT